MKTLGLYCFSAFCLGIATNAVLHHLLPGARPFGRSPAGEHFDQRPFGSDGGPPHHGPGEPPPPEGFIEHMLDEAQVSQQQREQIRAIDSQHRQTIAKLQADVDAKRHDFRPRLSDKATPAELTQQFGALLDAKRRLEEAHFAMMMSMQSALTAEQRARIDAAMQARGGMHGPGDEGSEGRGPGDHGPGDRGPDDRGPGDHGGARGP